MLLREILFHKGHDVVTCAPEETLMQAVSRLVQHNIGSLVVIEQGRMVGIITERDLLRACDAESGCLTREQVRARMTANPVTGSPDDEIAAVMGLMTQRRIRHLPIMDGDELMGMISIGDLVKAHHAEVSRENHFLKTYIQS
jgi:CBS domain-containing protein